MKRYLPFLLVIVYLLVFGACVQAQQNPLPNPDPANGPVPLTPAFDGTIPPFPGPGQPVPDPDTLRGLLADVIAGVNVAQAQEKKDDKQPAYIHLICAPRAVVTIDGHATNSTGVFRKFETDPFAGTGTVVVSVCNGDRCNTYTLTLTAGQTTLLTAFGAPVGAVWGQTGPCGYCPAGACASGQCAAGCPNGQCGQRAFYPQLFFGGFGGGCRGGSCR